MSTYGRNQESYFRKPLNYSMFYVLLVRSNGIWTIDTSSWNENEVEHARREEKRLFPLHSTKIVTSPTDDDRVITKIVAGMNR